MRKKSLSAKKRNYKIIADNLSDKRINNIFKLFKNNLKKKIDVKKYGAAISGGPDSMALAYLIYRYNLVNKKKCFYYHVDHQLRKNSFEEAQKYKTAMSERGAIVTISKEAIPSVQNTSKQIEFRSIEAKLAEPGALLIDYKTVEPANFDTSKFSLSEVGAILTEPVSIQAPQYDFSRFIVKKMDE